MKTKSRKQNKALLTGFDPSTNVEILQRFEVTKALLQFIADIKHVRAIIPDLEKWEQNEIEMKYGYEVGRISNLVRDCELRLAGKYYQETGELLPPIQIGSSLGVRVGWLRFVENHLIGKELQKKAEYISAAVSRDSAAILTEQNSKANTEHLSIKKIVHTLLDENKNMLVKKCIEITNAKLEKQGKTVCEGSIRNAYSKEKKLLKK